MQGMRTAIIGLASVLVVTLGSGVRAQMQLPGSVPSTQKGQLQTPAFTTPAPVGASRGEDLLPGKSLYFLGQAGRMSLGRSAKSLTFTLTAVGRKGNDIRQICSADFTATGAVTLTAKGRPDGLPRYEAVLTGCTINLDLLNDAVLVSAPGGACKLADDCTIDPSGLWGPKGDALPKESDIEAMRGHAEKQVNEARKTITAQLKKPAEQQAFLSEHVSAMSNRDRFCRFYAGVGGPGYCVAKYTEGYAARLSMRVRR